MQHAGQNWLAPLAARRFFTFFSRLSNDTLTHGPLRPRRGPHAQCRLSARAEPARHFHGSARAHECCDALHTRRVGEVHLRTASEAHTSVRDPHAARNTGVPSKRLGIRVIRREGTVLFNANAVHRDHRVGGQAKRNYLTARKAPRAEEKASQQRLKDAFHGQQQEPGQRSGATTGSTASTSKGNQIEEATGTSVQKAPLSEPLDKNSGEASSSTKLIGLLRHMPHSVVVITACAPDFNAVGDEHSTSNYCAMTVSSFTSVSMTENPVISFNVKQPSRTLQAMRKWGDFIVHVLDHTREAALVANAFTAGDAAAGFRLITGPQIGAAISQPLQPSEQEPPAIMAPRINHPAIVATLSCRIRGPDVFIEDHAIVFGTVERVDVGPSRVGLSLAEPIQPFSGLMYQSKTYRKAGGLVLDPARSRSGEP